MCGYPARRLASVLRLLQPDVWCQYTAPRCVGGKGGRGGIKFTLQLYVILGCVLDQTDAFPGMSLFLYACETWTITADAERRMQALEMRCFRKVLGILYRDHTTNEEVKTRIGNAMGCMKTS